MFERFTDRARRVVVLAQEEARMLNHNYIGTEHFLLGLILEGEGVGALALRNLGINLEDVRQQVEDLLGRGQQGPSGHIPFTPRAKKVLELSLREALDLGHDYIGTEHILLGIVREGQGVAAQVLAAMGAGEDEIRAKMSELLGPAVGRPGERAGEPRFIGASPQLLEVITRLRAIENRLAAIERQLGVAPGPRGARAPGEPGDPPEPGQPGEPGAAATE